MDISISKSVRQGVFIHLWNALQLYTCIYLLLFRAHCEKKASRIYLDNKETDQSRYMHSDNVSKF